MSTLGRKKAAYHHGDLRSGLLQAAGFLLEDEGLAGLLLREVARRAGVSHNAPYRHFKDREALLAALAAEGFEMLAKAMQANEGREMGQAYVSFALAHPQRFRLMFGGVLKMDEHPQLAVQARANYSGLERAFADSGVDAKYAAAAAWSLVHGLAQLLLDGHFAAAVKEQGIEVFSRKVIAAVRFAGRSSS
jgi:AcrR family transcriptional regulator